MAAPKICALDGSRYRGSAAVHVGTLRHRRAAFRVAHPLGSRKSARRIVRGESARRIRRLGSYGGEEHIKVKPHRRRKPLNGPRHVVPVRSYFRWNAQKYAR